MIPWCIWYGPAGDTARQLDGNILNAQPVCWLGKLVRKTAIGKFQMYRRDVIALSLVGTLYGNLGCTWS